MRAGGLALEQPVTAEFGIGLATVQDVVGDHQDRVGHGDRGAFVVAAPAEPAVLGSQVGVLGAGGGVGGLHQRAAQPFGALAGAARVVLAGRLVVARAQPRPGGQVRGRGELAHVPTGLGQDNLGGAPVDPGDGLQQLQDRGVQGGDAAISALSRSMVASAASMRASISPTSSPWWGPKRPTRASWSWGSLARRRPLASSARSWGSRTPATRACSIARPETPRMSLATHDSLMPASSRSFSSRWASRVRSWMTVLR